MITDSFDFDQNGHWKNQKGLQQSRCDGNKTQRRHKKNPQAGYTLGVVRSLLPHLGFWAGRQYRGMGVPPDLA
jgi:hypothetical protein